MKKIGFMICLLFLCFFTVSAEEIEYQNVITDETTIEEDFQVLGMDIEEYYQPKYNYSKWYVVGMSESYDIPTYDIQTYFYIYNPMKLESFTQELEIDGEWCSSELESITLEYKLSNTTNFVNSKILDTNYEHHLLKVKGFKYPFCETAKIEILSIQDICTYMPGIVSESTFKATTNHSKLNGLSIELSFNSTLIIDDIVVAGIEITPKNSIFNYLFSGKFFEDLFKNGVNSKTLQLFFYNFNFPERIKPDSIEKAVFQYQKESWKKKYRLKGFNWNFQSEEKLNTESKNPTLSPKDFTFDIGDKREELNFPRFYLGNRINDKQFGDLVFKEEDSTLFNRDCSIFLDYNYEVVYERMEVNIFGTQPDTKYVEYSKLNDVELLELWYHQDGILYKCQVVSKPTDPIPITPKPDDPWYVKLWKFFVQIGEFIFETIGKVANEVWYGLTGIGICILGIACIPLTISLIVKLIIKLWVLPGKIIAKIFGG